MTNYFKITNYKSKKIICFKLLRFSGLPIIFRELFQKNKVTILLFHDISKETAENSILYLSKKYNIIDLDTFIEAIYTKDKTKIPKKSLILTFDDGHIMNYQLLEVFKKYKTPVTIFLCSGLINTKRHFWFNYNKALIESERLIYISNKDRLKILAKEGFRQDIEFEMPQALQKWQINEMKSYINMQSHTIFHPCLPRCCESEAREELFESKKFLEDHYDLKINTISYPNGDYSERDISLAKEAGYKCGITVDFGFNTIETDVFKLKRISVNDSSDLNEFIVKSSGLWAFLKTRIKKHFKDK